MLLPRIPLNLLKLAYNKFFGKEGWPYAASDVVTSPDVLSVNNVLDTYKLLPFRNNFGSILDLSRLSPESAKTGNLYGMQLRPPQPDMSLIAREPLPQFKGQGSYEPSWQERKNPTLGFLKYLVNRGELTESPTETHIFDLPHWWDYKQKPIQDYLFNQYLIDTNRPQLTQYYRHNFDTPDPPSSEEMIKSIYENNRSLFDKPIESQQGNILEFIKYLAQKGLLNESL